MLHTKFVVLFFFLGYLIMYSVLRLYTVGWQMIKWKGFGRKWSWYYHDIFLQELRKTTKTFIQDSWCPR
jgi:hypothetical protein